MWIFAYSVLFLPDGESACSGVRTTWSSNLNNKNESAMHPGASLEVFQWGGVGPSEYRQGQLGTDIFHMYNDIR